MVVKKFEEDILEYDSLPVYTAIYSNDKYNTPFFQISCFIDNKNNIHFKSFIYKENIKFSQDILESDYFCFLVSLDKKNVFSFYFNSNLDIFCKFNNKKIDENIILNTFSDENQKGVYSGFKFTFDYKLLKKYFLIENNISILYLNFFYKYDNNLIVSFKNLKYINNFESIDNLLKCEVKKDDIYI